MVLISMIRWWYGEGLYGQMIRVARMLGATSDYFSISTLLRTLFAPFRQISAAGVSGPIGVRFRAWFDKLVSRLVGGVIRILTSIAGLVMLAITGVVGVLLLVGWVVLPMLPIIGLAVGVTWRA